MALSSDIVTQFVKVTNDKTEIKTETTVNGTIVEYEGEKYVRIDGSDLLTPYESTADVENGERVTVMIKNHTATVTGNLSSPSARTDTVREVGEKVDEASSKISEFEIIIADKVSVDELDAVNGRIDNLVSENVTIKGELTAHQATIDTLTADNVTINEKLTAYEADIENLKTTKLDAEVADITYATIEDLEATNATVYNLEATYGDFQVLTTDKFAAIDADIKDLQTTRLTAEQADLKYADIDFANIGEAAIENFYAKSGVIQDVVISEGQVTGTLVGVTIKGDLIEGGTIVADKLVIQGEDGLYYKLNTNGETVSAEQTEYNSLSGTIITAQSITAEKIAVDDLVAFDATIGGFSITDHAIYSGVKSSVDNTTRGTYMDNYGQIAFGDSLNYVKFYKDEDGEYHLAISAEDMIISSSGKNVGDAVDEAQKAADAAITNSVEEFYQSTSPTELIGGSWSLVQPTWTEGTYIWRRTKNTYGSGDIEYSPSENGVCITGNTGEKGDPGDSGSGYTILLTNESHTFPASTTAARASSTSTDVIAYKNTTQIIATISKIGNTSVSGNATGIATGITGLTADVTNNGSNSCAIKFNATASLTDQSGTVVVTIVVDGQTFTKKFSYALSMTGADGTNGTSAKAVDIVASSQVFKSTDGGQTFSPDTIKLTPAFQGGLTYSKWQYSTDGGTNWTDVSSESNGLTISNSVLTISKDSALYTDEITAISFKCVGNDSTYTDTVTVVKLYDVTDLEIGGRNLWQNGDFSMAMPVGDVWFQNGDGFEEIVSLEEGNRTGFSNAMHTLDQYARVRCDRFTSDSEELVGKTLTMQCWVKYENVTAGENSWNALNIGKFALVYTLEDGTTTSANYSSIIKGGVTGTSDGWVKFIGSIKLRDDVAKVNMGTIWIGLENSTSGEVWVTGIKLEIGNTPTDWTPAPEDTDQKIEDTEASLQVIISEQETTISKNNEEILLQALSSYVEKDEFENYKEETSAQMSIMSDEIEMKFTEMAAGVQETEEGLEEVNTNLTKYFSFSTDGLIIKCGEGEMQLHLDNDIIRFEKNGKEFGWWDGVDFHTGNIYVDVYERAQFGNFAFVPRSDGSLSFLKVDDYKAVIITKQPVSQKVAAGTPVSFTVEATGSIVKYRWQRKKYGVVSDQAGTSNVLTFNNPTSSNSGYSYRAKITDKKGYVFYSDWATLTVT